MSDLEDLLLVREAVRRAKTQSFHESLKWMLKVPPPTEPDHYWALRRLLDPPITAEATRIAAVYRELRTWEEA